MRAAVGRCRSGRTGRIRNPLYPQGYLGFESLSPRHIDETPKPQASGFLLWGFRFRPWGQECHARFLLDSGQNNGSARSLGGQLLQTPRTPCFKRAFLLSVTAR